MSASFLILNDYFCVLDFPLGLVLRVEWDNTSQKNQGSLDGIWRTCWERNFDVDKTQPTTYPCMITEAVQKSDSMLKKSRRTPKVQTPSGLRRPPLWNSILLCSGRLNQEFLHHILLLSGLKIVDLIIFYICIYEITF